MGCFSMPKGVPNKRYTPEFKKLVVETLMKEKLSYRETARQFEIDNDKCIAAWERIYLTEGPEGFAVERRARQQGPSAKAAAERHRGGFAGRGSASACGGRIPKNLQALVLEDERRQRSNGHKCGDRTGMRNPKNQHSKESQNADDNRLGKQQVEGILGMLFNVPVCAVLFSLYLEFMKKARAL